MLKERLELLKKRIDKAARKTNRSLTDISIVCVTKQANLKDLVEVIKSGLFEIGENRFQAAEKKVSFLKSTLRPDDFLRLRLHMVGHLQTNKVAKAVRLFDLIQSVDSLRLARLINAQAEKIDKYIDVLIQVNLADESSKFGISFTQAHDLIAGVTHLSNLKLKGLMGIARFDENPEQARPCFRQLHELYKNSNEFLSSRSNAAMSILSMGMSDDFEVAIAEGANMVRIGRAIFGG